MPTTNRRRSRTSEETRDQLLDAAARLFREQGYESTSLKDLAAGVGVSPSAMYWHFSSKSDLLYSVVERTLRRFHAQLAAKLEATDGSPTARLEAYVRYYVGVQLHESPEVAAYSYLYATGHMMDHLPEEQGAELRRYERMVYQLLRTMILDGVRSHQFDVTHPSTAAFAISGMCETVQTWYRHDGPDSIDDVADRYVELVFSMVRATDGR